MQQARSFARSAKSPVDTKVLHEVQKAWCTSSMAKPERICNRTCPTQIGCTNELPAGLETVPLQNHSKTVHESCPKRGRAAAPGQAEARARTGATASVSGRLLWSCRTTATVLSRAFPAELDGSKSSWRTYVAANQTHRANHIVLHLTARPPSNLQARTPEPPVCLAARVADVDACPFLCIKFHRVIGGWGIHNPEGFSS